MNKPTIPIKESALNTDLNELAHTVTCELAMAFRKVSIYGAGHPQSARAVEKPFFILSDIFRFKHLITLNVQRGNLYLMNICLKDTVFNRQIIQYLQALDIGAVIFDNSMTIREFTFFMQSLVDRNVVFDPESHLGEHLKANNIESITVNTERAVTLFENRKQYRGDVDGDYSVKRLVMDQLGRDMLMLARIHETDQNELLDYGVDFDRSIIDYLLPEKIAQFSANDVRATLTELVESINANDADQKAKDAATAGYLSLIKLVRLHQDYESILANVDAHVFADDDTNESPADPSSATGRIKIQSSQQAETMLEELFNPDPGEHDIEEFCDSFARLLKTGQQSKARKIARRLVEFLSAANPDYRQKALDLASAVIQRIDFAINQTAIEAMVDEVTARLDMKEETFEYSEIVWHLFDACHGKRQYELMARLTKAMSKRRRVTGNVTVYDSTAVKRGFANISQPATIDQLINELIAATSDDAKHLKDILVAIGTEEVAVALSRIISHPVRTVRQQTLKVLAELGRPSLKVFGRMMSDNGMFEREPNRHELPDSKWYIIRNSIFVLGLLRDSQAVIALRHRISDPDVRIRREIVSALEKIGGEEAVDCLILMAEDRDQEIREAAVIAIGLVGTPESAPLLIDVARKNPSESFKAVAALGKLGGDDAAEFLGHLLENPKALAELTRGQVSKDELRVAVVKALGAIGDQIAIDKLTAFKESQSTASKLFFKNSSLNQALTEALSQR